MKRYNKMICRMCSLFTPFSARAGHCNEDGEEKLAFKACVNRDDFELHPKGRARNLKGEVNARNKLKGEDVAEGAKDGNSKAKVKSGGNEDPKTKGSNVSGKGAGPGAEKVQDQKRDSSGSASKRLQKPSGKGDKKRGKSKNK